MTEPSAPPPSRLLSSLTAALLRSRPELAVALAKALDAEVPAYRPGERLTEADLRESCAAHIDFVCSGATPTPADEARVRAIGVSRLRSGIAIEDMLDAVRVGSQFLWGAIVDFARSESKASDEQLVEVAGQVWSLSGDFAGLLSAGYRDEQRAQLVNGQHERFALIDVILSGRDEPAATFWQSIDRIGVPRDRPYAVVAIETRETAQLPAPGLEQRLRNEGLFSIWLLRGEVELGLVSVLEGQIPAVRAALQHYDVRAGISPVGENFAHTPQAVRLARTALASAGPAQVAFFADAAIPTIVAGAPDVADALAAIVLERVLQLPEPERELTLDAARHWFAAGGQVAEAARTMFVHPNTVRNRLRRLEALTYRDLSDPRQAAEIYLALTSMTQ